MGNSWAVGTPFADHSKENGTTDQTTHPTAERSDSQLEDEDDLRGALE